MHLSSGRAGSRASLLLVAVMAGGAPACADHVPDQDLRILQAVPVAKLTTDLFWKEFQTDARAATRKYHGQAVELSGKVTGLVEDQPPARILFDQSTPARSGAIEARLLDERAKAAFADVSVGQRVTLRCFVEGLATNIVLKSCIRL
jgi:hypothetical protein